MGYGTESKGPIFGLMANTGSSYLGVKNNAVTVPVLLPCTIHGIGVLLGNNLATNNCVMTITSRTMPANTTNNSVVANFTIGPYNNTTDGQIWYAKNNFVPVDLNAGDELLFSASDGGGSFTFHPWIDANVRAETKANNNDFVGVNNTSA